MENPKCGICGGTGWLQFSSGHKFSGISQACSCEEGAAALQEMPGMGYTQAQIQEAQANRLKLGEFPTSKLFLGPGMNNFHGQ